MILLERNVKCPSSRGKRGSQTLTPSHPHANHKDSERWVMEGVGSGDDGGVAGRGGVHIISTEAARQTGLLNVHSSCKMKTF